MGVVIQAIDPHNQGDLNRCDGTFTVDSRLVLSAEDGAICYSVVSVPPYAKRYPVEDIDAESYIDSPDRIVFFAYVDGQLAGQIRLFRNWNRFAYIDDIAVDKHFRRQGIGRALIQQAITWARQNAFPGLMLETQDNNVAACRLYQACGFTLAGFDRSLYQAMEIGKGEIALYWYLIF